MLPINIDLGGLVEEFSLLPNQTEQLQTSVIDKIAVDFMNKWQDIVKRELHQSRNDYKRAMYAERVAPNEIIFGLSYSKENPLPLMIEEGSAPFDEKVGFSQSAKKKEKKDGGWYLTIPFRHATSSAIAESSSFDTIMPKIIYAIAKGNAGRSVSKTQLPSEFQSLGVRPTIKLPTGVEIQEYTHKSPIYQGLVRINIPSGNIEKRGGYFTFRRVSDTSDANSWWNKGLTPRKFMDRAIESTDISLVADTAINEFLKNINV